MISSQKFEELCGTERKRLAALRFQLLESHPFWGYLLLQMKLVFQADLPSFAATDGFKHIWFNPELTEKLNIKQLGFVLLHEICHSVFASFQRQGCRDLHLWNCATDYAINRIIMEISQPNSWCKKPLYEMPVLKIEGTETSLLYNPSFSGMSAEMIYERLAEEELQKPSIIVLKLNMPGGAESGNEKNDPDSQSENESLDGKNQLEIPNLQNHNGGVDIHVPIELSPQQKEELCDRIRAAGEAWRKSNQKGHLPTDDIRHLVGGEKSRVPWNRLLHRYASQSLAKEDYSLARPNKRYLSQDMVLPGLYSESVNLVVISLDTSGSVDNSILAKAMNEIAKLKDLVEEVILIVCDCEIHEVVATSQLPRYVKDMKVKGGGGTSHLPVFSYIEEKKLCPDLFIGITDLESIFPDNPPFFPVLWLTPGNCNQKPPFGKAIKMND